MILCKTNARQSEVRTLLGRTFIQTSVTRRISILTPQMISFVTKRGSRHLMGSGMFGVTREAARARSWNYVFDSINFIAWKESRMTQLKRRVFLADARRIKPLRQAFRIRNWALESQEGDLHICQINVMSHFVSTPLTRSNSMFSTNISNSLK